MILVWMFLLPHFGFGAKWMMGMIGLSLSAADVEVLSKLHHIRPVSCLASFLPRAQRRKEGGSLPPSLGRSRFLLFPGNFIIRAQRNDRDPQIQSRAWGDGG